MDLRRALAEDVVNLKISTDAGGALVDTTNEIVVDGFETINLESDDALCLIQTYQLDADTSHHSLHYHKLVCSYPLFFLNGEVNTQSLFIRSDFRSTVLHSWVKYYKILRNHRNCFFSMQK